MPTGTFRFTAGAVRPSSRDSPDGAFPLRYLAAASLARLADEGARVGFILLALERTSSATFGGLLVAALLTPHILAAPVVGALADRVHHRRRFYAAALLLFGLVLALCAVLVGHTSRVLILLLAMAGGVVGPLLTGGMTGLLRDLVAPTEVDRAYRLDMVSYNAAGICGPALAAIIAGWMNAEVAIFALAGGTGVAAAIVLTLPIPDREADTSASTEPLTRAFSQGIGVFLRDRLLRSVTIASCLGQLGVGATPLAIALIATEHYSASTAGVLLSASAVGGLVGSLAYARFPVGSGRPERVVLACLAGAVPPFCVLAYDAGSLFPTGLLCAIVGVLSGPLGSSLFVIRDRRAPPSIHAQVFTTGAGLKITSAAGGSAVAGMLAGIGASWLLMVIALFHLMAAFTGAILLKRAR